MRKESAEKLSGNDQFEGYAIDLTREIAKVLGFNYTFRLVPDGRHGSYNKETGYSTVFFNFENTYLLCSPFLFFVHFIIVVNGMEWYESYLNKELI